MDTFKIIPFPTIEKMTKKVVAALENHKCDSAAFIGYGDVILGVFKELLDTYDFDVSFVHYDDFSYGDIYQLIIDEDFRLFIEPAKDKDGEYRLNDAEKQFVSDDVSTRYVRLLEDNGIKYTVFHITGYDEQEFDDSDDEAESCLEKEKKKTNKDAIDKKSEVIDYDDLSDDEKQIFDMMIDWFLW